MEIRYRAWFGADADKARTFDEKLAFGKRLLDESKTADSNYKRFLEAKALDFLYQAHSPDACELMIAIHRKHVSDFPHERIPNQERLVYAYDALFWRTKGSNEKTEIQKQRVSEYCTLAGFYEEAYEFERAASAFDKARNLSRALKLDDKLVHQIDLAYNINKESADRHSKIEALVALAETALAEKRDVIVQKRGSATWQMDSDIALAQAGDYFFALGDFERARHFYPRSRVFRLLDIASKDGIKESVNGLSEETANKYKEAAARQDRKTIEELLPAFEVEPSLWYHVERARNRDYSGLEQRAGELLTSKKQVSGHIFLRLGDIFAEKLSGYKRVQPCKEIISLCQNALIYYEGAVKRLEDGTDKTRAQQVVATLEKRLAELGGVRKGLRLATGFQLPEGCQLYFSFDRDTIVRGDLKDGQIVAGDKWIVKDLSGNNRHGIIYGGNPNIVPGVKGEALSFDGVGNYIDVPELNIAAGPISLTISFYIKPFDDKNHSQCLRAKINQWNAFLIHSDRNQGMYCGVNANHKFTPSDLPKGTLDLNKRNFFLFSYEGISRRARFYKNGELLAEKRMANPTFEWQGFLIGDQISRSSIFGILDELMILDKVTD
jgi:tetratricopeptide (TPR) repeat protein